AARAAAFSFATISGGVPLGANKPFQPCASNSGRPACADVGRSGNVASRTVDPTTSPLTSLSSIDCETEAAASQTPSICPPIASVNAGAAPRYPTSVTSIPAACAKLLQIKKFEEP